MNSPTLPRFQPQLYPPNVRLSFLPVVQSSGPCIVSPTLLHNKDVMDSSIDLHPIGVVNPGWLLIHHSKISRVKLVGTVFTRSAKDRITNLFPAYWNLTRVSIHARSRHHPREPQIGASSPSIRHAACSLPLSRIQTYLLLK